MKKLFFFLIIVLISFLSIDTHAQSFKFVWENTLVEVPYGDSVEKYKDIPKAYLYVDGKIKTDANITYNKDGDWLCYLKDVDTTKLRDYYVWYKAYENDIYKPGTCLDYKCKVQFKIVDKEAPEIKILNDEIIINSNNKSFDLLSNVNIYDNCDKNLNITVSPKFEELGIGEHTIKIYASDESGNSTLASYILKIEDSTIPYFLKTKSSDLIFDLNSNPSLEGYFEAYDDIDGNITSKINYPSIDTSKIGDYEYYLSVKDSNGNEAKELINVKIKDLTIPEIELVKDSDLLSYKLNLDSFDYFKYIKNIKDNDLIDYNKLTYETNLCNKVGSYYIRYKYDDGINNIYKDVIIKLMSYEKPIIKTNTIPVLVGKYTDIKPMIEIEDLSDDNINSSIIITDDNVNYYKEGSYIVDVYAINSSGISTNEKVEIKVLNNKDYNNYLKIETNTSNISPLIYIFSSIIILFLIGFTIFIIILKKKKKI